MIFTILGGIGSGKTLLLTFLSHAFYNDGYNIYANYHLKRIKYINLMNVTDFLKIKTHPNFFALDEGWLNMDSRRSGSLMNLIHSKSILQSRKIEAHVGITTQTWMQLDKRIRSVTALVFQPEIIIRDDNGKPLALKVTYFKNEGKRRMNEIFIPLVPPMIDIDIPESYDTLEIVDELESNERQEMETLVKKYLNDPKTEGLKPTKLKSYITMQELIKNGHMLESSKSGTIANYIDTLRSMED
jgi:hypothetical protein